MAETVLALVAAHRAGTATPVETMARCYARIRAHNDPAVFITLRVTFPDSAAGGRFWRKQNSFLVITGLVPVIPLRDAVP